MTDEGQLEADRPTGRATGLRLFRVMLSINRAVLLIASVGLGAMVATGSGTVTVPVDVDTPDTVEFVEGRAVEAASDGSTGSTVADDDVHSTHTIETPSVETEAVVDLDDHRSRLVVAAGVGTFLTLLWVGLGNMRRIVQSALDGNPFDPANVRRLQWIAAAAAAMPILTKAVEWALNHYLAVSPVGRALIQHPSWYVYLLLGAGALALAEVFREGSRLQALDEATV